MVFYFIFEALYCRFFFFFFILTKHLLRYIWRLRPFLLSSSFSPLLLFNNSFFSFCPHRYPLNGITPCCFYRLFLLFIRIRFFFLLLLLLIVSSMDATIPVVYLRRSKFCVAFSPFSHFFLPFLFPFSFTRLSYSILSDYSPREIDIAVQTWTREPMNF